MKKNDLTHRGKGRTPRANAQRSRVEVVREAPKKRTEAKNLSWYKIYQAADRADFKGWFYLPTLQPAEQANSLNRRVITERIDYLYKNVSPLAAAIDGVADDEAGTGLWPKWITSSSDYNKAMTDRYHEAVSDPRFFSSDGETDGYTCQYNIRRMIYLYGDCFGQMLTPAAGRSLPLMHMIAGWRVDSNLSIAGPPEAQRDGIIRDDLGRAISYSVQGGEYASQSNQFQTVPAHQMIHFHDPFLPGQTRGVSCLSGAVMKMFKREDLLKAIQNGALARERLGFAIQTKDDGGSMPALPDIGGEGEVVTVKQPDGTNLTVMRLFGDDADEKISIPHLPEGTEIKTVESNRPGGPVMDLVDRLIGDVAFSMKRPPEYLFFLSKLGQGTVSRIVLRICVQRDRSTRARQLIPQYCKRWIPFWAWQAIKNGLLDSSIKIPDDWYRFKILSDGDKSVDLGREGKLYDDRAATGKMSIERYHALEGEDAEDVEDENLAVIERRLKKLDKLNKRTGQTFTYHDIWSPSTQNPQVKLQGNPPPDDE